jgi:hypothetical protein
MISLAILYISLVFYFYTDPSNPQYLRIGGIILVSFMIIVPLLYSLIGTLHMIIFTFHKRDLNYDDESLTVLAWIKQALRALAKIPRHCGEILLDTCENILKNHKDILKSYKSGKLKEVIRAYFHLMKTLSTFRSFRSNWERLRRPVLAFILLEFVVFSIFFALSILEMFKLPRKSLSPN